VRKGENGLLEPKGKDANAQGNKGPGWITPERVSDEYRKKVMEQVWGMSI